MNSRTVLVLLSAIGAVAALPTMSATAMAMEQHEDRLDFDADSVLRRLQDRGVAATSVEQWNGLVRAYVEVDGKLIMQYFDPDTLAAVDA
ncbi:hypothetical protein [Devosia sp. Root635]|uniref:hypothetical protein n=1 Tax=Devosia sp. Root635 TaxID=1736575 RepID=UPI000AEE59EF|nr:hypothetical protein [Devosia sp. Root635]